MTNAQRTAMTKLMIETTATRLFSVKDYQAVTMNEIAREAGYTKRTVYKHFASKEAILSAAFETFQKEHYELLITAVSKCATPRESLFAIVNTTFRFTDSHRNFMKMLWTINDESWGQKLPPEISERISAWNEIIFQFCTDHIRGLQFKPGYTFTPEELIHYISAMNKGIYIQAYKDTSRAITESSAEDLIRRLLDIAVKSLEAMLA